MAKTKRRRCDYCGNQYRYSRSTSKTCSPAHRQALHEQRKAEEAESEQRQMEPNGGRYMQLAAHLGQKPAKPSTEPVMSHEEELDALMKIVLPDGPPRGARMPAPPPPDPREPPAYVIIKNVPTRFPGTPLNRGRQG